MAGINAKNWRPTEAHRQKQIAQRAVTELMKTTMKDRTLLLRIVIDGPKQWRKTARKAFRGMPVTDDAIEELWKIFVLEAGDDPKGQYQALEAAGLVRLKIDRIRGLCRFITSERHMDDLLEKVTDEAERAAIRAVMVPILRQTGVLPPLPS